MDNSGKIILDLCGGTGAWSKPYKDAGYDVRVITLPDWDIFDIEISKNAVVFNKQTPTQFKGDSYMAIKYKDIYGILAAPTCTMFSLARTTGKTPRDFNDGMKLVEGCLQVIWASRKEGGLKFWALENPMGYLRQFLGKPPLTFNPIDYGDQHTKRTDLWGFYNQPKKSPVKMNDKQLKQMSNNTRELPKLPTDYVLPVGFNKQAARRSVTPQGFAEAFYKANK